MPTKAVINCETNEVSYVELTDEEIAAQEAAAQEAAAQFAAQEAEKARVDALKASAKAKLVSGQALTEEEASVLVI